MPKPEVPIHVETVGQWKALILEAESGDFPRITGDLPGRLASLPL
jgi:hypothetical protein